MLLASSTRPRTAPSTARLFVRETLGQWGLDPLSEDAELLVDELVLNVLEHADYGEAQIDIRANDGVVRVDVTDHEPDFREAPETEHPDDTPRFGLRIVDSVADRWGVAVSPTGKSVWFELDLRDDVSAVTAPPS